MGIESFFARLISEFNIITQINPSSKIYIKSDYLFIDFNSIIHVVSQKINTIIDKALVESLKEVNGCGTGDSTEYLEFLNLDNPFILNSDSEQKVIESYQNFFTTSHLDDIIIKNVGIYLKDLLTKFNKDKLQKVYISIDGVPSKAKIVEQKKRRFMGEFEKHIKKQLVEKHKDTLDKNKSSDCHVPFNKYNYLRNHISWSRGNISPASFFMVKLGRFLNSASFKNEVNKIVPLVKSKNFIVSNFTEKDEGEKKIMDFINNPNNEVKGDICIYSPDADIILLSMILKNKNINKTVIRIDQQRSRKLEITYAIYDIVDIDKLENNIYTYMDNMSLNKINVINDIVFIFTIFGDDFLHKIESFNVRTDIKLILDIYKSYISSKNYILQDINNLKTINYKNFIELLKLLVKEENELIKRNYLMKKYKNYSYLMTTLNKKLSNDNQLDHTTIIEFINKFFTNKEIDSFEKQIDTLLNKFIIVDFLPKLKFTISHLKDISITISNINLIPIKYFIEFITRTYKDQDYSKIENGDKDFNKDIYLHLIDDNKLKYLKKSFDKIIDFKMLNDKLFKSENIQAALIKDKYTFNDSNPRKVIELLIFYYYIYNELPIKKFSVPELNMKSLRLEHWPTSINDNKFRQDVGTFTEYEKEIFQFDNMLDEYQTKLNKHYEIPLGNPDLSFEDGKKKYYKYFFNNIDLDVCIRMYIDGLQWLVDYYYNSITYHKWYYLYNKSPLLQDILTYLNNIDDDNIFDNSKKALQTCCRLSITEELTPLEQLMYITPFDKDASQLKMFTGYSPSLIKKIGMITSEIKSNEEFSNLYPDISNIAKTILTENTNTDVDCRSAIFMNKCILNVVTDSNMIDETRFREHFRNIISSEDQIKAYTSQSGGGKNDLFNKLKRTKQKFKITGDLKYKKEYKRLSSFLND